MLIQRRNNIVCPVGDNQTGRGLDQICYERGYDAGQALSRHALFERHGLAEDLLGAQKIIYINTARITRVI